MLAPLTHGPVVECPAAEIIARTSELSSTSEFLLRSVVTLHVCPAPVQCVSQLSVSAAMVHAACAFDIRQVRRINEATSIGNAQTRGPFAMHGPFLTLTILFTPHD
jgi:hypothetical protein